MSRFGSESGSFVPRNWVFLSFSTHPGLVSKFEEDDRRAIKGCQEQAQNVVKVWMPVETNKCLAFSQKNAVIV